MERLIEKELRRAKRHKNAGRRKRILARAAIILLVLVTTSFVLANTVEAVRVFFDEIAMTVKNGFAEIMIGDKEGAELTVITGWEGEYYPTYIPSGFYVLQLEDFGDSRIIEYRNDETDQNIVYQELESPEIRFGVSTNDAVIKDVKINGYDGKSFERDIMSQVVWINGGRRFSIEGMIPINEIIKIACSVKLN